MNSQRKATTTRRTFLSRALAGSGMAMLPFAGRVARAQAPALSPNAVVIVSGLDNPRGLKFGPDGKLYVAEGGRGGALSTVGQCPQVTPPIGPYTGGYTARISRVDVDRGVRETVVDGLPSSTNSTPGADTLGVGDVAFIGDTLYALIAGAGCSHGLAGTTNGVIRVNDDGTTTQIADLSTFQKNNPVQNPDPDDFEPDGTWYSMIAVRGDLYAVEPNHEEIDKITLDGTIERVVDMSALHQPVPIGQWIGPTSLAHHGDFHVGNLGPFPMAQGAENVYRITPSGQVKVEFPGLTAVLGVVFDDGGQLYVLESFTGHPFPSPDAAGTGQVLRVDPNGQLETVASGLSFPAAMTFGPDGQLYVSNKGFSSGPGVGEVVRIRVH